MPTRVQLPDGSIGEFPDGMAESEIEKVLQKQFGAPQSKPSTVVPSQPKPIANGGMGTLGDTVKEGGKSLLNMVSGPLRSFGEGAAKGGVQNGMSQVLSDMFVKPSVDEWNAGPVPGDNSALTRNFPTVDKALRAFPIAGPMGAGAYRTAHEEGIAPAAAQLLTPLIAGELAPRVAGPLGRISERTGLDLGNNALGATGPKPFKYGANPARGAYEEGALPSMSKHGASMAVEEALPKAGKRINDKITNSAGTAPSSKVAASITGPLNDALDVIGGPGGGGRSMQPIFDLYDSMQKPAPLAKASVFGSGAPADIPASDLWRTIQNVDKNTRFNPDPEVEGVNELRRSVRGGLRGNLEEAAPGLKPLSQRYGDLAGAQDALDRTMHGGMTLGHMLDVAKFPLQTTLGRGAYVGGRVAQAAVPTLRDLVPAAVAASNDKKKEKI